MNYVGSIHSVLHVTQFARKDRLDMMNDNRLYMGISVDLNNWGFPVTSITGDFPWTCD